VIKRKVPLTAIALIILCWLHFQNSAAQGLPKLAEFLDKLTKIRPVTEVLTYDTFPDFDFEKFHGLNKSHSSKTMRYVVGSSRDKKIRTISPIKGTDVLGTMTLYEFNSFTIMTFEKRK
jgi:hypothetical protein